MIFCRAPYNYDPDKASQEAGFDTGPESRVQQHQLEETDINVIVRRFLKTGVLPQLRDGGSYGDFTAAPDFTEAQYIVRAGKEAFAALPVQVQKRFNGDPAAFVEFATNPENESELRKMGLLDPQPAPKDAGKPTEPVSGAPDGKPGTTPQGGDGKPPSGRL